MRCDVLIIDVGFRGERSPLVMNAIQQVRDKSRVIVHAVYPDPEHVWRMFQEGVWGVLEKSGDFGELENAVGTVASGSLYVDRAILARAGRDFLSMIQRENFGPAGSQSSRSDPA
jgi:DNA-binding NarL/FixJ family response regulator